MMSRWKFGQSHISHTNSEVLEKSPAESSIPQKQPPLHHHQSKKSSKSSHSHSHSHFHSISPSSPSDVKKDVLGTITFVSVSSSSSSPSSPPTTLTLVASPSLLSSSSSSSSSSCSSSSSPSSSPYSSFVSSSPPSSSSSPSSISPFSSSSCPSLSPSPSPSPSTSQLQAVLEEESAHLHSSDPLMAGTLNEGKKVRPDQKSMEAQMKSKSSGSLPTFSSKFKTPLSGSASLSKRFANWSFRPEQPVQLMKSSVLMELLFTQLLLIIDTRDTGDLVETLDPDSYHAHHIITSINIPMAKITSPEDLTKHLESDPLTLLPVIYHAIELRYTIVVYDQDKNSQLAENFCQMLPCIKTPLGDSQFDPKLIFHLKGGFTEFKTQFPMGCGGTQTLSVPELPVATNAFGVVVENDFDLVFDRIYIGRRIDCTCSEKSVLKKLKVSHIVNVSTKKDDEFHTENFETIFEFMDENNTQQIYDIVEKTARWIERALKIDDRNIVYVHCTRGLNRSPIVVMGYLMLCHDYSLRKAFELIKSKRPAIGPLCNFMRQLVLLERKIHLERRPQRSLSSGSSPVFPHRRPSSEDTRIVEIGIISKIEGDLSDIGRAKSGNTSCDEDGDDSEDVGCLVNFTNDVIDDPSHLSNIKINSAPSSLNSNSQLLADRVHKDERNSRSSSDPDLKTQTVNSKSIKSPKRSRSIENLHDDSLDIIDHSSSFSTPTSSTSSSSSSSQFDSHSSSSSSSSEKSHKKRKLLSITSTKSQHGGTKTDHPSPSAVSSSSSRLMTPSQIETPEFYTPSLPLQIYALHELGHEDYFRNIALFHPGGNQLRRKKKNISNVISAFFSKKKKD